MSILEFGFNKTKPGTPKKVSWWRPSYVVKRQTLIYNISPRNQLIVNISSKYLQQSTSMIGFIILHTWFSSLFHSFSECVEVWAASMTVCRLFVAFGVAVVGAGYTASSAWWPLKASSVTVMASRCWRSRSFSCWFSRLMSSLCFFRASRCRTAALMLRISCCGSGNSNTSYIRHRGRSV